MKRNVLWLLGTLSAVVLMFGYHTSTSGSSASTSGQTAIVAGATGSAGSNSSSSSTSSTSSGSGGSGSGGSGSDGSKAANTSARSTVTGNVANTQWGPVQVQLTVSGSKITRVAVVRYPSGNGRDQEINSYALPILTKETLTAQSANIDMVSGATVTSGGYLQSLQSALDKANV